MKIRLSTIFSLLLIVILMGGIIFIGYMLYHIINEDDGKKISENDKQSIIAVDTEVIGIDNTKKASSDTISEIENTVEESKTDYTPTKNNNKYFYEQLSETQKIIYNGLQQSKTEMRTGEYSIQFGEKFSDILAKENGSDILTIDYQAAIDAFTQDNMDMFFMDFTKLYLNIETKKRTFSTTYNVYIGPKQNEKYLANGFKTKEDVDLAFSQIEDVKNKVHARLTGNTYTDITMIHDYLVDNLSYESQGINSNRYTIYGALVEKVCVCEGYARSFKYLLDDANIECILMQGTGKNEENSLPERHAWNAVNIGGTWYLIDVTWDDPVFKGNGVILKKYHYKYFLLGSKRFYQNHTPETSFSDDGKEFTYPPISELDY